MTVSEMPLLYLSQLSWWTDRKRNPLEDEDHSENDPQLVSGYKRKFPGTVPEKVRRVHEEIA